MPIYDYICSSCAHRVEVIHGIHDAGPRFCPSCGADGTMRKALVTPAIHFKGSGWAKKDRSSTSSARPSASSNASTTSGTDGASSDAASSSATAGDSAGGSGSSNAPRTASPSSEG